MIHDFQFESDRVLHQMRLLKTNPCQEERHCQADELLCDLLRSYHDVVLNEIVREFYDLDKWYA